MLDPAIGIPAMVLLVEGGKAIGNIGHHQFRALPRKGEFLVHDLEGVANLYEVLQVHHATEGGGIDLFVRHLGQEFGYYNSGQRD